jgi:hypothetical protein
MSDLTHLVSGPAGYYRDDQPVSRGQWADIAKLALEVLGLEVPESRYDATVVTVRLRAAAEHAKPDVPIVPEAW